MSVKSLNNPFVLSGYYGAHYFCDRLKELEALHAHVENERNIVLYSWRRMGKTALINHFFMDLENATKTETIYIDLLSTRDFNEALRQITFAVYQKFGRTSTGISAPFQKLIGKIAIELSFDPHTGIPTFGIGLRQGPAPGSSLQAIGLFLADRKSRIVIAIDEFQQVSQYTNENGEAIFRTWMQAFPSIRFIFSGSHRTMMTAMFSEKNRPFYRSAQLLSLDPIPREAYTRFIKTHFQKSNKSITTKTINEIYDWSRGQTYCIQVVCNKLFGKFTKITRKNLPEVFNEILDQESPIFAQYANLLTITQWKTLKAIAIDEPVANPLSKKFLQDHQLGAASSVSTALKMLQKSEIVVRENTLYQVHDILLTRWLQRR